MTQSSELELLNDSYDVHVVGSNYYKSPGFADFSYKKIGIKDKWSNLMINTFRYTQQKMILENQ